MAYDLRLLNRFHRKYVCGLEGGCWLWTGAVTSKGYGRLPLWSGGHVRAHRLSYELHVGPIPAGLFVLHSCDTPACVNPAHLRVGTHQDNTMDAIERRRFCVGSRVGTSKLTEGAVRHIKRREMRSREYASLYEVSDTTVRDILRGKSWGTVT